MRNCLIMTAFLGLSFIQCSKADEPPPKYPDGTSFCNGMATAQCSDTVLSNCATTKDVCIGKAASACLSTYVTSAAGLTYSSGQAEKCVNQVSSAYSDAVITASEKQAFTAACDTVYSGSGTKGSACVQDKDCKESDSLHCVIHAATSGTSDAGEGEGTCQVPVSTSPGNSCSKIDAECTDGFHCYLQYCVANGDAGSDCTNGSAPCSTGLQCSAGKCIAQFADNTACTSDDQCLNGICIATTSGNICAGREILAPSEPSCAALK